MESVFKEIDKSDKKSKDWIIKKYTPTEIDKIQVEAIEKIEDMESYRRGGCYYDANENSIEERYKRDDKLFLMLSKIDDSGWANVKSSALFKNVRAIESDFRKSDLIDRFDWYSKKDEGTVKILEAIVRTNNKKNKTRFIDAKVFRDMVVYGKGYDITDWNKITCKIPQMRSASELTDEEKEDLGKGVLPYKWVDYVEFNDYDTQYVDPNSVLVERGAYRIHSRKKGANFVALKEWVSHEDFKRETKYNKGVFQENIKKVQPAGSHTGSTFWSDINTEGYENQVLKIRYFDKVNAREVLIYNDVVVAVKPLPFGMIPVNDYSFMDIRDEFYVPGLSVLLDPLIREEEDIKNEIINAIKIAINPPMFADSRIANELSANNGERMELGEIMPISGFSEIAKPFEPLPTGNAKIGEAFSLLGTFDQNITEISGVNARRFGSMQRSYNATEVQVVDGATANIIDMIKDGFLEARTNRVKLQIKWIEQEYSKPILQDRYGKKLEEPTQRSIRIEGEEFEYNEVIGDYDWRDIEGASEITIPKEGLKTIEDIGIYVDPESMPKMSRQAEIQLWQNFLPQIAPMMGDPRMVQPGMPTPIFDVNKVMRKISKLVDAESTMVRQVEPNIDQEIEESYTENQKIVDGEYLTGRPGRTLEHVQIHEQLMLMYEDFIERKKKETDEKIPPEMKQQMMMMGMQIPEDQALQDMELRLRYLRYHIDVDKTQLGSQLPMKPQPVEPNQFGGMLPPMPQAQPGTPTPMPGSPIPSASQDINNMM